MCNKCKCISFVDIDESKLIETPQVSYIDGVKYQVVADLIVKTEVYPPEDVITDLVVLRKDGWLLVKKYFGTDGPSGPTYDTPTNIRGAIIHDAFYFLFRKKKLSLLFKCKVDHELYKIMIKDGSLKIRAKYYKWAVLNFGKSAATKLRKIFKAPRK